jgi:hypothetical protein
VTIKYKPNANCSYSTAALFDDPELRNEVVLYMVSRNPKHPGAYHDLFSKTKLSRHYIIMITPRVLSIDI